MDFLAVSRCVRAGPRRFLSWFNHLQLPAPLVEAPRPYPKFSRQLTDVFTSLHAFDSHSLKFPGVSLSLHCGSFPGNCALFLCVSSRVHSIRSIGLKKFALRKLPVRDRKSVESVPRTARPAATSLKADNASAVSE